MKQRYNLRLLNEDIRIVSENGEEYVKNLGKYIHATIGKFDNVHTPFPMPYLNKALYACVFLADELFEARKEIEGLKEMLAAAQDKPVRQSKQSAAREAKNKEANKEASKDTGKDAGKETDKEASTDTDKGKA